LLREGLEIRKEDAHVRRYETIYILRPDLGDAQNSEITKRLEDILSSNQGEIIETDVWGQRELAYDIKAQHRGHYVRLDYVASPAAVNELERNLKLLDGALRFLSVLVSDDADVAAARAEVEARHRRAAEARAAAEARVAAREEAAAAAEEARAAAREAEEGREPESGEQHD
jgi:small subunit ribosomal protein S6